MHTLSPLQESRIKVVVRKRPLGKKETGNIIEVHPQVSGQPAALTLHEPKLKVDMTAYIESHRFMYDDIFDEDASNRRVYEATAAPLISRLFTKGQTSTCFAYGATGAGKTHTMMGTDAEPGLYLLAAADLFSALSTPEHGHLRLHVASFEIYGGKVFDLLNNRDALPVREDGKKKINVVGLREAHVPDMESFREKIREAQNARQTAATLANADSSRSHAILQLSLKRAKGSKGMPSSGAATALAAAAAAAEARGGAAATSVSALEEVGRFSFIDLAGTERGADTLNCENKERRAEGAEINKSLLALKECIRGLDSGKTHIPFRGSKLTEVLRDSFIGDCHTVMIGAVAPCIASIEPTLNTLRYTNLVRAFSSGATSAASAVADKAAVSAVASHTGAPTSVPEPLATLPEDAPAAAVAPSSAREKPLPTATRGLRPPQAVGPRGRRGSLAMSREAQASANAAVAAANASVAAAVAAAREASEAPSADAPPPAAPPPPPPPAQEPATADDRAPNARSSTGSNASIAESLGLLSPLLTTLQVGGSSPRSGAPPPPPPDAPPPLETSPAIVDAPAVDDGAVPARQRKSLLGNLFGLLGPPALGGPAAPSAGAAPAEADAFTCAAPAMDDSRPAPVDVEVAALAAPPELTSVSSDISECIPSVGITSKRPSKARKEAWNDTKDASKELTGALAPGDDVAPWKDDKDGTKEITLDLKTALAAKNASDANAATLGPPTTGKAAVAVEKKAIAKAGVAVFDAHRQFITCCVDQLEVHTYMLSHAEEQPVDATSQLDDYVGSLEALLRERQASLSALQAELEKFRCVMKSAGNVSA